LEDLDKLLTKWRSELDGVQTTLLELEDMMIYKIMKEKDQRDQLTGDTEKKVTRAFDVVVKLWSQVGLLEAVYKKATDKRQNLPTFGKGKVIDEIEHILTANIVLDTEEVPFDQRGLFSGSQRNHEVSPQQLREMMARSFESAKKVFLELQDKVSALHQQFEAVRAETEALKTKALSYSSALPAEVSDLLARLESTDKRRKKD